MISNGLAYGEMQLISEIYLLLKNVGNLNNCELSKIFSKWNETKELESYLIEISSKIFLKKDEKNIENYLIDNILDESGIIAINKRK
jgi:6-phosphogluconate dehydrogenase